MTSLINPKVFKLKYLKFDLRRLGASFNDLEQYNANSSADVKGVNFIG